MLSVINMYYIHCLQKACEGEVKSSAFLYTSTELNVGDRVLDGVEKNSFIALQDKRGHSRLLPQKNTMCPNQGGYDGQFYSNSSRVRLLTRLGYVQGLRTFPGDISGKEPACQCRDGRDLGLIAGSGRSPGGGHGNLLQYFCLGNPIDGGVWQATVCGVTKSWTQQLSAIAAGAFAICLCRDWILFCCSCWPSTSPEESSGWRMRHFALQETWWNRSLDG